MKSKRIFAFLMAVAMMLTVFSGLSVFAETESVSFVAERDGDKFVINFVANEQMTFGGLQLNGHTTYDTEVFTYTGLSSTVLDCTQGVDPMADQGNATLVTVEPGTTFLTINYTVDTEKFEAGKEYSFDIDIDMAYTNEYEEMDWGGKVHTVTYKEDAEPSVEPVQFVIYRDGDNIKIDIIANVEITFGGLQFNGHSTYDTEVFEYVGISSDVLECTQGVDPMADQGNAMLVTVEPGTTFLTINYTIDTSAFQTGVDYTFIVDVDSAYTNEYEEMSWGGKLYTLVYSEEAPATHTVTFVDYDGTVIDTQTVGHGAAATAPTDPTREGYTFTGWDKDFSNVTEDITVTAQYRINSYQLKIYYIKDTTYGALQNPVIVTLEYGAEYSYASPASIEWDGQTWLLKDEDQAVISGTMPAHDVEIDVLYYLYVAPTYTVTFVDWNGAVIDTQVVSEGEAATAPNDPTREGYTFTGWDKDFSNVTEDITVTAQYRINTYTVTINYYRWSDVLEDWVAAIDAKTFTYEYGAEYDMTDMIPEDIDGNLRDHIEGVVSGTMPAENVVINAYYVKPYEPTAPTVEAETVELRERATADGKSDIRFIFKVTFNDSYVVEGEDNYGPTEEYYKITRLYVEMVRSDNSTPRTLECKNLYTVSDDSFEFTVVIKNIPATGNDVVFTMTPYIDYTYNGVNGTATNTPIESSVNMVGQND